MYAIDGSEMQTIPCIWAFPERVAFGSFSTELGEVNIYLNACKIDAKLGTRGGGHKHTFTRSEL
jgi:hypothetical protein